MTSQPLNAEIPLEQAFTDAEQRTVILERCAKYLELLARSQFDPRIQGRLSVSDVVQETMLEAHRDIAKFRGSTTGQFMAWLRQVLVHNLAEAIDGHVGAAKRDVRRERSIDQLATSVEGSARRLAKMLIDSRCSPSEDAVRHEELLSLADALSELPKNYYEVIVCRHLEGLSFREVAQRMGRTEGAVRMIWFRAIDRMRMILARKGVL